MLLNLVFNALTTAINFLEPLSEPVSRPRKLLLFLLLFILDFFTYKFQLLSILTPFGIIFCAVFVFVSTKRRLLNVTAALFTYISLVAVNNLLLFLYHALFHITVTQVNSDNLLSLLHYTLFLVVSFLYAHLIGYYMKHRFPMALYERHKRVVILVLAQLLVCASILVFNILFAQALGYPAHAITFNCILFVLYFVLSTALLVGILLTYQKNVRAQQQEAQYNQLLDYVDSMEKTAKTLRSFKHDYQNTLLTLNGLIHGDDKDALIRYFDSQISPISLQLDAVPTQLSDLSNIPDPAIKGLLSAKIQVALAHAISVRLEVAERIDGFSLEPYTLARILGILLDNATEGALETKAPQLDLAIVSIGNALMIIISNSCDAEVDTKAIFEDGYTTKGEGHGTGLASVLKLLESEKYACLSTSLKNGMFTQILQMPIVRAPKNKKQK